VKWKQSIWWFTAITIFSTLASLFGGSFAATPEVLAAANVGGTIVRCQPAPETDPAGETVSVDLFIENVQQLYGADLRMSFDTSMAQAVDADASTDGVQIQPLSEFLVPGFIIKREADNSAGTIWYAVTQTDPTPPANGSGAVARVTFQPLTAGSLALSFTRADLADRNGTPIPATSQDCAIGLGMGSRVYLPLIQTR
jgi:hypothetical protein